MNIGIKNPQFFGLLLLSLVASKDVIALTPVVTVSAQHYGGLIVYNYRLINQSEYAISSVQIGYDVSKRNAPNNYGYELLSYPSGTVNQDIPPASITSPAQWEASFVEPEGMVEGSVEWSVSDDNSPRLAAGQTLSGLSIKLDKPDRSYVASHATISFSNSVAPRVSVLMQNLDTTPPVLSFTLNPAATAATQRGQMVDINALISVTDDYDPAPEIKLESITVSESALVLQVQGAQIGTDDRSFSLLAIRNNPAVVRTYNITYSATDASGNVSRSTVAFPVN